MIVKGYELLKMVDEEKIQDGTIVTIVKPTTVSTKYIYVSGTFWKYVNNKAYTEMCASILIEFIFEIPEKEENKKIEEYSTNYTERCIDKKVREKLNEVIRAVNKLNEQSENNKDTNCMTD